MRKKHIKFSAIVISLIVLFTGVYYLFIKNRHRLSSDKNLNVILISIDAARADRFSFHGYPVNLTPNIDKLAYSGVVFRKTYCFAGNTSASMGSIFTSRIPYWPLEVPGGGPRWQVKHHYGFTRFQESGSLQAGIPKSLETIQTTLKKHDYTTIGISTNPYLTRDFNFNQGFDFFEEFSSNWRQPYASVERVVSKLDSYISELKHKKFFAWIHLMDLHYPLRDFQKFLNEAKSRGLKSGPEASPVSEWTQEAVNILSGFGKRHIPDWKPGEEGLGKALAKYILAYEAELFRIDKQIGLLMKNLRRRNVGDNTLVIIITDHGEEFAEHTFWDHRGQLYELIVNGLWVMHCPKLFPKPVMVEKRVSMIDLLPTLLDLLHLEGNDLSFDGKSQAPLLKKNLGEKGGLVFGLMDRRAYIVDEDYKLIVNRDFGKEDRGAHPDPPVAPIELFNLKQDPQELHNLADELPSMVDKLLIRLKQAFLEKGIRLWEGSQSREVSEKTRERLRSLGYLK